MKTTNRAGAGTNRIRSQVRFLSFVLLMLYILVNPAINQLAGVKSVFSRPWSMYADSAEGVLKGEFLVTKQGVQVRSASPFEVMNLARFPYAPGLERPHQVTSATDLHRIASTFCESMDEPFKVSFKGWIATKNGWEPLAGSDLCGARQ